MNVVAKTAQPAATDRLLQALSTLAALLDRTITEVKTLDGEFEDRMLNAILETETALEAKANDHLRTALAETEQRTRSEVSTELREQFQKEITTAVAAVRTELLAEKDKISTELRQVAQVAAHSEAERARLAAECERAAHLLSETKVEQARMFTEAEKSRTSALERDKAAAVERVRQELSVERDRLNLRVEQLTKSAASWEEERLRLVREHDETVKALKDAKAERTRLLEEVERATKAAAVAKSGPARPILSESAQTEISRVEGLIENISTMIDDPSSELSTVIRKNVERAELDSYLRGIRFAVNGK